VQVSRVDLDGRKIDFRMVREGEGERPPGRAEKPRAAGTAVAELEGVRAADRAAKASTRSGKAAAEPGGRARRPGAQRPAPKPRTRR